MRLHLFGKSDHKWLFQLPQYVLYPDSCRQKSRSLSLFPVYVSKMTKETFIVLLTLCISFQTFSP